MRTGGEEVLVWAVVLRGGGGSVRRGRGKCFPVTDAKFNRSRMDTVPQGSEVKESLTSVFFIYKSGGTEDLVRLPNICMHHHLALSLTKFN